MEDEEAISSVAHTVLVTPIRDSLDQTSNTNQDNDESANFSLTPCQKDYDDESSEETDDDLDEDGSLILGRSSEQISSSLASVISRQ